MSETIQQHSLAASPMNSCAGGLRSSAMAVSLRTSVLQPSCRSVSRRRMTCGHHKRQVQHSAAINQKARRSMMILQLQVADTAGRQLATGTASIGRAQPKI